MANAGITVPAAAASTMPIRPRLPALRPRPSAAASTIGLNSMTRPVAEGTTKDNARPMPALSTTKPV